MRVGLDEEPELKIARFIKELSPNITSKVELQHSLSFDDVCLVIKVEKQLKGRKSFHTPLTKSPFNHIKVETPPPQVKALDKGKGIASEPPKSLEENKCFKCYSFGHFQVDYPNTKALTINEVEEIRAIEEELSEEDDENDGSTLVTLDIGQMLLIKRSLHATKVPYEDSPRE